jgi:succinate dehydrogenase/fumarate reductase flavoprotein subunit
MSAELPLRNDMLTLHSDVLVLGGGPAGTWAAWKAASEGARVVLADKGYCGTSGSAAAGGNNVWYVPPDPQKRELAKRSREARGGYLSDRGWMDRVLDRAYANVNQLGEWGYPFPLDDDGIPQRGSLQGPEYMRLMRKKVLGAGVRILDHSPALELLVDNDGVAGARGVRRQEGTRWRVTTGAVVIATGGCAFLSKALGLNVLTGDGGLLAAEAGAEMSGMEFSNAYALAPSFASVTKGFMYTWASFYGADGKKLEGGGPLDRRTLVARGLERGPVFAQLDQAPAHAHAWMRAAQPNFFLPFDRARVDPFRDRFAVTLRFEGTVRGTGGIRIAGADCRTSVPGLYAAGDAATRELICGGVTGGGSHNAAWAMSSGWWAGEGAARFGRTQPRARAPRPTALASSTNADHPFDAEGLVRAVQAEVFPFDRSLFREEEGMRRSRDRLEQLWTEVRGPTGSGTREIVRARELVAMVATARWMFDAALARRESRGMHLRTDHREQDPSQQRRLLSGGLEQTWVRPEVEGVRAPAVEAVA